VLVLTTAVVRTATLLLTLHAVVQEVSPSPNDAVVRIESRSPAADPLGDSERASVATRPSAATSPYGLDPEWKTSLILSPSDEEAELTNALAIGTSNTSDGSGSSKDPFGWRIDLYPVFAWAPVFGASAAVPVSPDPHPGPTPSGSVSGSFNGAVFGGFAVAKNKWAASGNVLWVGLSGQRQTPLVKIDTNFIYGQFMLGREVLPHLFAEAGFRRTAFKISATIGNFPQISWKPGIWDPLVGLTYRHYLGQKWRFRIHGDGGGFGVGNDAAISGTASAEWCFARHFGLLFGYGVLYFRNSGVIADQPINIKETLHGPMFGFGIHLGRGEMTAQEP
jgi:hypothetical protein